MSEEKETKRSVSYNLEHKGKSNRFAACTLKVQQYYELHEIVVLIS